MYPLIAVISTIIRQFVLPNPFDCFGAYAVLINWISEPIIHWLSFALVGAIGYESGDCPALGSLLYLGANAAITGALYLIGLLLTFLFM